MAACEDMDVVRGDLGPLQDTGEHLDSVEATHRLRALCLYEVRFTKSPTPLYPPP